MMRRWVVFVLVACSFSTVHAERTGDSVTLSLPPSSLAKWYKPVNKRQVWLHTMFGLRRSMQAVSEYAALKDQPHLENWAHRLAKDYRRIVEMVPEWKDEVELKWADRLVEAAVRGDEGAVGTALHRIGATCNSCHNEYRSVVAALYRAPDFNSVRVEYAETLEEVPYHDVMEDLSRSVNRIRIGMVDGRLDAAREATQRLKMRLRDLGENCAACHRDPSARQRVLGVETDNTLEALAKGVEAGQVETTGRLLGEIGVNVCSRCHGTHRTLSDLRGQLLPRQREH